MKKKILLITCIISTISILSIIIFNSMNNKENNMIENAYEETKKNVKNNFLTLMLETEENSGIYEKSTTSTWPGEDYVFNEELSRCENGGELSWDESTNTVKLLSNKSDACYVYFDIFTETPRTFAQMIENEEITINTNEFDFSSQAPHPVSYKDSIYRSGTYEITSTNSSNYYTYADSYTFDTSTGQYDLVNPSFGIFSNIYSNLVGKYVISYSGSTSSTMPSYTDRRKVYRIDEVSYNSSTNTGTINYSYFYRVTDQLSTDDVGLFITSDDLGQVYIFRGNVENNYVKFGKYSDNYPDKYYGFYYEDSYSTALEYSSLSECESASNYNYNCTEVSLAGKDIYWRIVRTNGDGSIRLIYDGTQPYENGESSIDRFAGYSRFNSLNDDNAYVGFMYGTPDATTYNATHSNTNNSTIKTFLDNWYKSVIFINNEYNKHIADAIYCNDRSLSSGTGIAEQQTIYMSSERRKQASPSLLCSQQNDRFSVATSINGIATNGALTYPVGLITLDESGYAGSTYGMETNTNYYLYTGNDCFAMSPYSKSNNPSPSQERWNIARLWLVSYNTVAPVANSHGVKPVISLASDTLFLGDGTMENPFTVVD